MRRLRRKLETLSFAFGIGAMALLPSCGDDENAGRQQTAQSECGGHGRVRQGACECNPGYTQAPHNTQQCVLAPGPGAERLVVADTAEQRLYVFEVGTWEQLAEFSGR